MTSKQKIVERRAQEESLPIQSMALQAAANAIVLAGVDGTIQWVNPAFTRLTGYSVEEAIGQNPRILRSGCHDKAYYRDLWDTIKGGQVWHNEIINRRKNGELYTEEMTITPVTDETGQVIRFIAIKQDISQRKQAEEALRESEERYQIFINATADMVFVKDEQFRHLIANRALATFLGTTPEKVIGKTDFELMPAHGAEGCRASDVQVIQNRSVVVAEERIGDRIFEATKFPVPLSGRQMGVGGIIRDITERKRAEEDLRMVTADLIRDITERKQAEEALRATTARLETLIQVSPLATMMVDLEDKIQLWNPAAERIFGWTAQEVIGHPNPVVPKMRRDEYESSAQQILQGTPLITFETILQRKDGTLVDVSTSSAPTYDASGRVTGRMAIIADIGERKRAEQEREQLLAQIQAQACQIAQIIEAVPEGVLLLDATGRVLLANPVAERDLSTLAQARVGDQLTHLGDRPLVELLTSPPKGLWHELRAGHRSFEVIARPLANGAEPEHWVLVIDDVTQARAVRAQLEQQERLAAVGQLAAGIAHDFNNILAVIALYAPLAARAAGLSERDRERLRIISEQTQQATRLVQQILDFSRRAVLERQALDLLPLLKEQVKLLRRTLPENIRIETDWEPGEYVVFADPTRIQQMLMNLAVNARDAMPQGGSLRLVLARQSGAPRAGLAAGSWIRLAVADSGMGIAAETLPHLFEPFYTTKPRGQGTGLGLAQVYGIVKQHEGEIEVHSSVGQGARFTIYLPALGQPEPAERPVAQDLPRGAGETILIVEDNPTLLEALSDLVELLDYRVVRATNGQEALARLAERPGEIALVLSDLVMSVLGGGALFEALREQGLGVPVVLMSGHGGGPELEALKARGLAGWLPKPTELDQVARVLAQVLGHRYA